MAKKKSRKRLRDVDSFIIDGIKRIQLVQQTSGAIEIHWRKLICHFTLFEQVLSSHWDEFNCIDLCEVAEIVGNKQKFRVNC